MFRTFGGNYISPIYISFTIKMTQTLKELHKHLIILYPVTNYNVVQ